jgi:N-hydroxyarylamine O-acetyltransferase
MRRHVQFAPAAVYASARDQERRREMTGRLQNNLVERVLERLGFASQPEATPAGLADLYGAWCRRVPFDNIRKLIHVRAGNSATLPGDTPNEFFEAWLAHGTGATCWAGNGALCNLLVSIGFDARRAAATMMVAPDIPPNHGSVVVHFGDERYVVDASMLFVQPLPLRPGARIDHPAWGIDARMVDGHFTIRWNALLRADLLDCRFNLYDVAPAQFSAYHEATRAWSPFNFNLNLNLVRGDGRIGAAAGNRVAIDGRGRIVRTPIDRDARKVFLVDEVGIHEEIVDLLPEDVEMAPPPDSRTAARS